MKKPKGSVRVSGKAEPFLSWVTVENLPWNECGVRLTEMDVAAVLVAIRRELRKRGYTVHK
jgi:hypothetical protein